MNYEKCYYDDDLKVQFFNYDDKTGDINEEKAEKHYLDNTFYKLTFVNGERINVIINGQVYAYNSPVLITAKPNANTQWSVLKAPYCFIEINILPVFFSIYKNTDEVLQFFYSLQNDETVFDLSKPQFQSLNTFINIIQTALFAKCGRFSVAARVNSLISELSLIYDTNYKEYVAATDSIAAQMIDFVEKNYAAKISLKLMCEKFFVSDKTVNSVFRLYKGASFWKCVSALRLKNAKQLIESGSYTTKTAAALSGFANYSAFYQGYKKRYGTSPSQDLKKDGRYCPLT